MGIRLRLTGPDGRDYVPGEPIDVFDGEALIGRVQSVTLSYDGTEVWVENFMTVDFEGFRAGALPRLVLAEVVNFIAERHPSVHMIGIELSRDHGQSFAALKTAQPMSYFGVTALGDKRIGVVGAEGVRLESIKPDAVAADGLKRRL